MALSAVIQFRGEPGRDIPEPVRREQMEYRDSDGNPLPTLIDCITAIEGWVREMKGAPATDEEMTDAAGRIAKISKTINAFKKGLLAETPVATKGGGYIVKSGGRSCARTYNVPRLVLDIGEADGDPETYVTLIKLIQKDALRLTVQYSNMMKEIERLGLTVVIQKSELEDANKQGVVWSGDLDAAHIGEVWTDNESTIEADSDAQR